MHGYIGYHIFTIIDNKICHTVQCDKIFDFEDRYDTYNSDIHINNKYYIIFTCDNDNKVIFIDKITNDIEYRFIGVPYNSYKYIIDDIIFGFLENIIMQYDMSTNNMTTISYKGNSDSTLIKPMILY